MGDEFETPLEVLSRAASMVAEKIDTKESRGAPEYPLRAKKEQRLRDRGTLYRRQNSNNNKQMNANNKSDSEEIPLDMSTRPPPPQYQRPSVITCASALRAGASHCNTNNCKKDEEDEDKVGTRRVEFSGLCDPVIDEHFRRSLGKDYQQVFETKHSFSSTGMSVDDHFAKALGETWYRLQAQAKKTENSKIPSANTTSNSPSTNGTANGKGPLLSSPRGGLVST